MPGQKRVFIRLHFDELYAEFATRLKRGERSNTNPAQVHAVPDKLITDFETAYTKFVRAREALVAYCDEHPPDEKRA